MKRLIFPVLALLLVMPAMAIEFTTWASNNAFVYPLDEEAQVFVSIKKDFFDSVEDLKYKITVTGPASFPDGSNEVSSEIAELEESLTENHTLKLKHTPSLKGETVVVTLSGTYVSNSFFMGGKKTFNASTTFSVLSRDVSDPEGEDRVVVSNSQSDAELRSEVYELQKENAQLQAELKVAQEELESKTDALNSVIFWILIIVLFTVLGASGYFYMKKKFKHKKKFKEEDY